MLTCRPPISAFNRRQPRCGGGSPGNRSLAAAIRTLASNPALRQELGDLGRNHVVLTHGLDPVTDGLATFCGKAVSQPPDLISAAADATRSTYYYLRERRILVPSRDRFANPALSGR